MKYSCHCELKAKQSSLPSKVRAGLLRSLCSLAMTMAMLIPLISLSACGNKGNLKSPSEIALDKEKKEHKQAKEAKQKAKEEKAAQEKKEQERPQ